MRFKFVIAVTLALGICLNVFSKESATPMASNTSPQSTIQKKNLSSLNVAQQKTEAFKFDLLGKSVSFGQSIAEIEKLFPDIESENKKGSLDTYRIKFGTTDGLDEANSPYINFEFNKGTLSKVEVFFVSGPDAKGKESSQLASDTEKLEARFGKAKFTEGNEDSESYKKKWQNSNANLSLDYQNDSGAIRAERVYTVIRK